MECIQLRLPSGFLVVRTRRESLGDRVEPLIVLARPPGGFDQQAQPVGLQQPGPYGLPSGEALAQLCCPLLKVSLGATAQPRRIMP